MMMRLSRSLEGGKELNVADGTRIVCTALRPHMSLRFRKEVEHCAQEGASEGRLLGARRGSGFSVLSSEFSVLPTPSNVLYLGAL